MTSQTPGKTLLINHFLINNEWYLVDLPGYGFAQRGKENREQLKLAIDGIYNYPLLEGTKFMLGRMMRSSSKTASDDIVEYVLEMRKNGSLCRVEEDLSTNKENTIICSMGLKYAE